MSSRIFIFLALLIPQVVFAEYNIQVLNKTSEPVRFYWIAAGCAHIVDKKGFVCDSKVVNPGEYGDYTFKTGTSLQRVSVAGPKACEGNKGIVTGNNILLVTAESNCALSVIPNSVTVRNDRRETVKFKWLAVGCVGVVDGVTFVCRAATLAPGESDTYTFPSLTISRGMTWTSATCPTSPFQRFGGGRSVSDGIFGFSLSRTDKCPT